MQHLVSVPIWSVQAVGAAATLTSPVMATRMLNRVESLYILASSVAGAADVRVEYAVGRTETVLGSSDDNDDIITSTNTDFATNPEGLHFVSMPTILAPFFRIEVDEISGGGLTDTLVTLGLIFREEV